MIVWRLLASASVVLAAGDALDHLGGRGAALLGLAWGLFVGWCYSGEGGEWTGRRCGGSR